MRRYTFDETESLDRCLHDLAAYEVMKGRMAIPDDEEELASLRKKIIITFNQFKKGIQVGEFSFAFIKNFVLSRNGPYKQVRKTEDEYINDMMNGQDDLLDDEFSMDFLPISQREIDIAQIKSGMGDILREDIISEDDEDDGTKE